MQRIVIRSLGLGCGLALLCGALSGCGTKAMDWTFTDAQGTVRNLSDYQGQVVVIGFTNTWCDPCQDAALHMQSLQEKFGGQGVKVLSVSSWEQGNPEEYMAENGYTYGIMLNGTALAQQYDVTRLPTFVVIGVNGKVIYRHNGLNTSTPAKITKVVEKHLRRHGNEAFAKHDG